MRERERERERERHHHWDECAFSKKKEDTKVPLKIYVTRQSTNSALRNVHVTQYVTFMSKWYKLTLLWLQMFQIRMLRATR
jgi:hypothetical protein